MELAAEGLTGAINRLRRAQGRITGIIRTIEEGRDCEDVVTRLAAASRALDRAGSATIATGLQHCLADGATGHGEGDARQVRARLEKLFLSPA